jgi:hypothetical protein
MAPPPLDLQPALNLQLEVWKKFHCPVSFSKEFSQKEFFVIASFGRCKFRLDSDSVGSLLQSAIGGLAKDFNASQLCDRVFRFSVSCRQVGFFIYQLQHFKSGKFSFSHKKTYTFLLAIKKIELSFGHQFYFAFPFDHFL